MKNIFQIGCYTTAAKLYFLPKSKFSELLYIIMTGEIVNLPQTAKYTQLTDDMFWTYGGRILRFSTVMKKARHWTQS
jgi:hypothetical protein